MQLPDVITNMVKAQAQMDSAAFAQLFANDAVVFDEGNIHKGRAAIEQWNAHTNQQYNTTLQPMGYAPAGQGGVLTTQVAGSFPGSPIVVQYHFSFDKGLIQSLRITG